MDNLLNVSPGLVIWTIINFLVFIFILAKFGTKPIMNALKAREDKINNSIESAEKANQNAQKLLAESQEKLNRAQLEMNDIILKGKASAEELLKKAVEGAEQAKRVKVEEAIREIDRNKENALMELRSEVADLVVKAAEKLLETELDKEKHFKLVENYIEQIPKN